MNEAIDIQNLLKDYARPLADNGFTACTLKHIQTRQKHRRVILCSAATLGAFIALSQFPSLWNIIVNLNLPTATPMTLTTVSLLGFVAWAALDKGWSDAV